MKSLLALLSFVLLSTAAVAQIGQTLDPFGDGHINYPREYSYAPDGPSLKDLSNLETKFWQARATGNIDVLRQIVSDNAMIASSTGAINKKELIAEVESGDCKIKSYRLQGFVLKPSTPTSFVIGYRAEQDAVCNGRPLPPALSVSASYIRGAERRSAKWQSISHEETPASSH